MAFCRAARKCDAVLIFTGDGSGFVEKGVMCLIAAALGKPTILRPGGGRLVTQCERSRLFAWWVRTVLRHVSVVTCQSAYWVEFVRAMTDGRTKVVEIGNGIVDVHSGGTANVLFMSHGSGGLIIADTAGSTAAFTGKVSGFGAPNHSNGAQFIELGAVVFSAGEITSSYVVIRLWDWRRMIVPLSFFIEQPFQNWTRESAALIGTVFIYVDFPVPVEPPIITTTGQSTASNASENVTVRVPTRIRTPARAASATLVTTNAASGT